MRPAILRCCNRASSIATSLSWPTARLQILAVPVGGDKQMCVNKVGLSLDQKVWNCDGDWDSCCLACGKSLESQNKICDGWRCAKAGTGIWLKRDSDPCHAWDGSCYNARNVTPDPHVHTCAYQLTWGYSTCAEFKESKECDLQCDLCACSTGLGAFKEHCSGHGTCRANCKAKWCIDAHCECEHGWTGAKCDQAHTTTTTTTLLTCGPHQVTNCGQCPPDDCFDQCYWDGYQCQFKVDCGGTLAPSCRQCGDRFHCHGDCYWNETHFQCQDPKDPHLLYSCGETHRANSCSDCMAIFSQMDPAWKIHERAGCRGDCYYNPYFHTCQALPPSRPPHLHPECPANLTTCATNTPESENGPWEMEKLAQQTNQGVTGLLVLGSNYLSSFGEQYIGKQPPKTFAFTIKTLGQVSVLANILVTALTPQPAQPCSNTYSEEEYYLCIWDGIMPYVEQYVEDQLDNVENQDFQARIYGVLVRFREVAAYIQNSFKTYDLRSLEVTDHSPLKPIVNQTRNRTVANLENLYGYMRSTAGFYMKDNAPFSQVIYLSWWALLHTYIAFSLMSLDPETFQTEAYMYQFSKMMADYVDEIELRGRNAHEKRAHKVVMQNGKECTELECKECATTDNHYCRNEYETCSDCHKTTKAVDQWAKCTFDTGDLTLGNCVDVSDNGKETCPIESFKKGTCKKTQYSYDDCFEMASQCHHVYQNNVLYDADVAWFDLAVRTVPALRSLSQKLSGAWPGPEHVVGDSTCPSQPQKSLAKNAELAHVVCCSFKCSDDMCGPCEAKMMHWDQADSHCKAKNMHLCSAYELMLRKCCSQSCPGKVWTRSKNTIVVFASDEPCMSASDA